MQYDESIEESQQYLRLALEQIGKHRLPTNPINYSIWYEYATGKNIALNETIDNYLGDTDAFNNGLSKKIYHECIAGKKEVLNDLIRNELRKILGAVIGNIDTTNKQYSASESQLEFINESLTPSLSGTEVEKIVNQVRHEVQILESTNTSFKDQLDQATDEINQLKDQLEQYRKEAIKDPLTRIDNRRGFEQKLQSAINKAYEDGTSLCLIIADIDHFKIINDTHGHLVGDNVLRMVAATMKESVKGRDSVARIGGEEFAIILPDTPLEGATKLADDMRISFEKYDLKKKKTGESLGKITLSFGVTEYKRGEVTDDFVNRADKALYQSKNTGRNRITSV